MSLREHRIATRKEKEREKKQMLENILLKTPAPSLIPEDPQISSCCATRIPSELSYSWGRQKVKRDRTNLYGEIIKLQDKVDQFERKVQKYKKRSKRIKKKQQ